LVRALARDLLLVLVRVLADVVVARVRDLADVGMTDPHRSMRRRNDPRCDGLVAHRTPRLGNAQIDRTAVDRRGTVQAPDRPRSLHPTNSSVRRAADDHPGDNDGAVRVADRTRQLGRGGFGIAE
jgi:hypothetical protein